MKALERYIQEKYLIDINTNIYSCHPNSVNELRKILEKRLAKDKNANLNDIDVGNITDMQYIDSKTYMYGLFYDLDPHNIDISDWKVSQVKDMSYMFYDCENFTGNGLKNWNVENVIDFRFTFKYCKKLNVNLDNWKINKLATVDCMFMNCALEKNPPKWYKNRW